MSLNVASKEMNNYDSLFGWEGMLSALEKGEPGRLRRHGFIWHLQHAIGMKWDGSLGIVRLERLIPSIQARRIYRLSRSHDQWKRQITFRTLAQSTMRYHSWLLRKVSTLSRAFWFSGSGDGKKTGIGRLCRSKVWAWTIFDLQGRWTWPSCHLVELLHHDGLVQHPHFYWYAATSHLSISRSILPPTWREQSIFHRQRTMAFELGVLSSASLHIWVCQVCPQPSLPSDLTHLQVVTSWEYPRNTATCLMTTDLWPKVFWYHVQLWINSSSEIVFLWRLKFRSGRPVILIYSLQVSQ